ncbi:hypothetical protein F5Y19DRAFT_342685 [Xylariaceae sp. FL1651]|nr:hypothetical protein F5Y19DRAFT_342685 [Xylariaceae sp. FL1651]
MSMPNRHTPTVLRLTDSQHRTHNLSRHGPLSRLSQTSLFRLSFLTARTSTYSSLPYSTPGAIVSIVCFFALCLLPQPTTHNPHGHSTRLRASPAPCQVTACRLGPDLCLLFTTFLSHKYLDASLRSSPTLRTAIDDRCSKVASSKSTDGHVGVTRQILPPPPRRNRTQRPLPTSMHQVYIYAHANTIIACNS